MACTRRCTREKNKFHSFRAVSQKTQEIHMMMKVSAQGEALRTGFARTLNSKAGTNVAFQSELTSEETARDPHPFAVLSIPACQCGAVSPFSFVPRERSISMLTCVRVLIFWLRDERLVYESESYFERYQLLAQLSFIRAFVLP